jgi:hypothetical protein
VKTTQSIMHATSTALRTARHWVVGHLATVAIGALALGLSVTLILAASGLWFTPVAPDPPTPSTTTTSLAPVTNAARDTSPAQTVVTTLLADLHHETGYSASDPSFATSDPLLAGCAASTIPVAQISRSLTLSSTSLLVVANIDVFGAGLGALVVANTQASTSSCSGDYVQTTSPTGLDGFVSSGVNISGSSILEVTFRRGDVVISLYAFPTNYQSVTTATMALAGQLDVQLAPVLSSVCVNENAPVLDSRRNPTQSNYRPYETATVVTPPATLARPDLSLLNATLPVVVPPPKGSVISAPTPPVVPTIALTTTVRTPAKDTVGPGCGWAFTAMVVPPVPVPSNVAPLSVRQAAAVTQLKSSWAQWPKTVTMYLEAKAVYLRDLVSYEATIPTTTTTTTTTTTIATTTTIQSTTTTTTTSATSPPG